MLGDFFIIQVNLARQDASLHRCCSSRDCNLERTFWQKRFSNTIAGPRVCPAVAGIGTDAIVVRLNSIDSSELSRACCGSSLQLQQLSLKIRECVLFKKILKPDLMASSFSSLCCRWSRRHPHLVYFNSFKISKWINKKVCRWKSLADPSWTIHLGERTGIF